MRTIRLALAALLVTAATAFAEDQPPKPSPAADVAREVERLVDKEFYTPVKLPRFDPKTVSYADIDKALADLGTSHTGRYPTGSQDYAELADILRGQIRKPLERLYPPKGEVTYDGIGVATKLIDGRRHVSDVYEAGPAFGVMKVGDELISVDGKPFDSISSFKGRAGQTVAVTVRRKAGEPTRDVTVRVARISPHKMFSRSIDASMRVIEREGLKMGYVKIWALGSGDIEEIVTRGVTEGKLKDADGLIVDLRGRWGGMFGQVPELLTVEQPEVSFTGRDGKTSFASQTYDKPVVAIIDQGTRSALEMFAQLMRKQGSHLIGNRTAGAVLAVSAFMLPDDSLLVLPVADVRIDGERLEGKGVAPDREVAFRLPYAAGSDPQLNAAREDLARTICASVDRRSARPAACEASPG